MDWQDEGLIIGVRNHGETSSILEAMTASHGRHLGLVRGGRSSRMRPVLQPGNSVALTWRARLEEHLGTFTVEPVTSRAADIMSSQTAIYGIQLLGSHLRLLPERDPHPGLYQAALVVLQHLEDPMIGSGLMIRFEVALLEELGFGLDLSKCVSTGTTNDLRWVSPKSRCAVSNDAGEPWADKLIALPRFLTASNFLTSSSLELTELMDGFQLTGYFLEREIYRPRGIEAPEARRGFVKSLTKYNEGQH